MKKRFLPTFLALVLCLGLVIPAFAAVTQQPEASFDLPNGVTVSENTVAFQIRHITSEYSEEDGIVYTYDEVPTSDEVTYTALPLATMITVEHMRPGDDLSYYTTIYAYSDPDGDGIYEERMFFYHAGETSPYDPENYSILPLTERGPFTPPKGADRTLYTSSINVSATPVSGFTEEINGALTADTDELCRLFGPNTLIRVSMTLQLRYKAVEPAKDHFWFLITGEESSGPAPSTPSFTDVPDWCSAAVNWAVDENITSGTGGNEFSPLRTCTHAEILTFLWRAAGQKPAKAKAPVTVVSYFQDAVDWAYGEGMIGASFDAMADCTRADAVNYIWQAFNKHSAPASSFSDVPAGADYAPAVNWAVANGITKGTDDGTVFSPVKTCTRGEIVTLLHRAYVPEARLV